MPKKKSHYEKVLIVLKEAIGQNPAMTTEIIPKSDKVYHPLFRAMDLDQVSLKQKLKKKYEDCYSMLIISAYQLGDYDEMARAAKNALKSKVGREGLFYYYLGVSMYHLKEYPKGAKFLSQAMKDNQNPEVYHYLGLCLDRIKDGGNPPKGVETASQQKGINQKRLIPESIDVNVAIF